MITTSVRTSILLLCLQTGLACAGDCAPIWSRDFAPNSVDGYVAAVATANMSGRLGDEAVFVGGYFSTVPGTAAANVAMWNGTSWRPMGEGLNDVVLSLIMFDEDADGPSRPLLFAAGSFGFDRNNHDNFIARWDGARWSSVGGGLTDSRGFGFVSSMVVFDPDDSGPTPPALYVTGLFDHAGGTPARGCAKWDGKSWSAVDAGIVPYQSLQVIDFDGPGQNPLELLGASYLSSANVNGGVVVRWNGHKWETLKGVVDGAIYSLAGVDLDGDGPDGKTLFAGGSFNSVDGVDVHGIAQWTATGWSDLSGGLRHDPLSQSDVSALLSFDPDGPGPSPPLLVVGGAFAQAGDIDARNVASWNGSEWQPIGTGVSGTSSPYSTARVFSLTTLDRSKHDGSQPRLVVGGDFSYAGNERIEAVAAWDGFVWSSFPAKPGQGLNAPVTAMIVHDDDGNGPDAPALYASGYFSQAGYTPANYVAKLTDDGWKPLGDGMAVPSCDCTQPSVRGLASFDADGGGDDPPVLVAVGSFVFADNVEVNSIAQWNGEAWSSLAEGLSWKGSSYTSAMAMMVFDEDHDSTTPASLYVGGTFSHANHVLVNNVARWDGNSWSALGNGLSSESITGVDALAVFDDESSSGPSLYAAGNFTRSGTTPLNRIAKWNGLNWEPLGSGLDSSATALIVLDIDGDGPESPVLIAAGYFETAGGVPAHHIAQWDGIAWTPLGTGLNDAVFAMTVFDFDGPGPLGPSLVVGGSFTMAGSVPAAGLAAWDGTKWAPLIETLQGNFFGVTKVNALATLEDGKGSAMPSLFIAGDFLQINGVSSAHIARMEIAPQGDFDCDGLITRAEFNQWSECLAGPGAIGPYQHCNRVDADFDGDVDLYDLSRYLNSIDE